MENKSKKENCCLIIFKCIFFYRNYIFQWVWPLITLSVFALGVDRKIRCLYVFLLMMGYWTTMCIPHYVTAFLPIIMLPLLAIQTVDQVCKNYLRDINMLFYVTTFLSISIEQCGLPKRIILRCMLLSKCSLRQLNGIITFVAAALSMWCINSVVIKMMDSVIMNLLTELETQRIVTVMKRKTTVENPDAPSVPTNITKAFFLSTGYGVTIGGIGTLVGSACNLTFKGLYQLNYPHGNRIIFIEFMYLNFIPMVIILVLMWLSIQILLMGVCRNNADTRKIQTINNRKHKIKEIVSKQLQALGPITFQEKFIVVIVVVCCILWMMRYPDLIPGWNTLNSKLFSKKDYLDISLLAHPIIAMILMNAIPAVNTCKKSCSLKRTGRPTSTAPPLLSWDVFQREMPWGMILHIGAGFTLAQAIIESGLSEYMIIKLTLSHVLPQYVSLILLTFVTILLAEMIPQVVACNVTLSLAMQWSGAMRMHPIILTYPIAICSSWSFCTEHGSRTNELLVKYAKLSNADLFKYGIFTKIVAWSVTIIMIWLMSPIAYRNLDKYPSWANEKFNSTLKNNLNSITN